MLFRQQSRPSGRFAHTLRRQAEKRALKHMTASLAAGLVCEAAVYDVAIEK